MTAKWKSVLLDGRPDLGQRKGAIRCELKGLGLDAAQDGRSAPFIPVGMRILAHDVFISAPAMAEQCYQIALGATGKEKSSLMARHFRQPMLQAVHGRVFVIDIVSHFGGGHGTAHAGTRGGHGITAQVDQGGIHITGRTSENQWLPPHQVGFGIHLGTKRGRLRKKRWRS